MISMQTDTLTSCDVKKWIEYAKNKTIVAGYGSLMSGNSRIRFNNIDCHGISAEIKNWERHWITRSQDEKQTYVGAIPASNSSQTKNAVFNVQLVPVEMDEALIKREQDYKFTQISSQDFEFTEKLEDDAKQLLTDFFEKNPILICETLAVEASDKDYPVSLSYIATCLKGCFDHDGLAEMQKFMQQTQGWESAYVRVDTQEFDYPRAAQVTQEFLASCMSLIVQYVPEQNLLRE